jgi:hypothetical protein
MSVLFGVLVMKSNSRIALVATFCVLLAALTSPAAFGKAKQKRKADPAARIKKKLDAAELSAESKAKANKVIDEHAAKLKEAQAKVDAVLTAEQAQAQKQARKDARTAGKKGKEAKAALEAALKLTPEQKTKLAAAQTALQAAQGELTKALRGVLSSDEIAKVGLKMKKKKNT